MYLRRLFSRRVREVFAELADAFLNHLAFFAKPLLQPLGPLRGYMYIRRLFSRQVREVFAELAEDSLRMLKVLLGFHLLGLFYLSREFWQEVYKEQKPTALAVGPTYYQVDY